MPKFDNYIIRLYREQDNDESMPCGVLLDTQSNTSRDFHSWKELIELIEFKALQEG